MLVIVVFQTEIMTYVDVLLRQPNLSQYFYNDFHIMDYLENFRGSIHFVWYYYKA